MVNKQNEILTEFDVRGTRWTTKGQIISKGLIGVLEFSKKTNEVVKTNLFIVFLENSRIPKVLSKLSDL